MVRRPRSAQAAVNAINRQREIQLIFGRVNFPSYIHISALPSLCPFLVFTLLSLVPIKHGIKLGLHSCNLLDQIGVDIYSPQ